MEFDQDEEIKYSAARKDVDNSKFNLLVNPASTKCGFDSFIRACHNEQDEL